MKTFYLCIAASVILSVQASAFEPDIVMDANENPGNVEFSPAESWIDETNVSQAFRGASKVRSSPAGTDYACFHTTLPSEGAWQVYVWQNSTSSGSGSIEITHAEGTKTISHYHSSTYSGQWLLAGTYWFNTESEAKVKIKGSASTLSADAVRFSLSRPDTILDTSLVAVTFQPTSAAWTSLTAKLGNRQNLHRSNTSNASVTFLPTLTASGDYDLSLWLPPASGLGWVESNQTPASTVEVDVHGRGGVITTHTVSLPSTGQHEGRWVRVGNAPFRFHANGQPGQLNPHPAKVVVKVGSSGTWVPVDAIRFSKLGASEVLMDDSDPEVVASPNPWGSYSSGLLPFSGIQYSHFGSGYRTEYFSSSSSSARSIKYKPYLEELGLYDVYLLYPFYPSSGGMTPSARVTLHTAVTDVHLTLDQRYGNGRWVHLGRYILNTSTDTDEAARPWVQISTPVSPYTPGTYPYYSWINSNQGNVVADSILFVKDNENLDTDGDGIMDWFEFLLNIDTSTNDWDSDGIPDGNDIDDYYTLWEVYHSNGGPPVLTVTSPIGAILY